ncbi:sensor histidine kinase [Bifidobacterium xylocopae]|nr:ATP-binding protein [Bifidobacterium xylocopae]
MGGWLERVRSRFSPVSHEDDAKADDLDETGQAILSLLGSVCVLVDREDRVVRSSPEAYGLAIVNHDRVVDERIQEAVRQAWRKGEVSRFRLVTDTPAAYAGMPASNARAGGGTLDPLAEGGAAAVSRPNWLKVAVGPIGPDLVLILVDDVSEAVRFERTRQSFVEHVSRQLLKPVDALGSLADDLRAMTQDPPEDKGGIQERMTAMGRQAHRVRDYSTYLEHTLNDLLLLIRAQESVRPSRNNLLDLADQARQALEQVRAQAAEAAVSLTCRMDDALVVHGDGEQIRTAIVKLLENAIRYSPAGSTVSLAAGPSPDGRFVLVRVIDRGLGIAKEEQNRVFERFYRGGGQTEASAVGIGLGLAIVKHVALTHHGSVSLWSAPGQGSTFTLALPRVKGPGREDEDAIAQGR